MPDPTFNGRRQKRIAAAIAAATLCLQPVPEIKLAKRYIVAAGKQIRWFAVSLATAPKADKQIGWNEGKSIAIFKFR